jgi:signal transduction histidine kinase
VEDITLSVAKYVEGKDINLIFDTEVEEKIIACDPDKIERIMLNLLSNAVKFTPEGGDIYVNIYEREDKIIIAVKDTGLGIPADMQGTIFDRFVQVDQSTSRLREGSGIGLSIVKAFVEQHKGSIELLSEVGQGSDFTLSLPVDLNISKEESSNNFVEYKCFEKIKMEFSDIYDNI